MFRSLKDFSKKFFSPSSSLDASRTQSGANAWEADQPSGARWDLIPPFRIDPLFFADGLTHEQKQKLFKENVEYIYIEPHSFCNRKCWFCPNSIYPRGSKMNKMDDELFTKILRDLTSIEYDGDVSFSLYNEPLADEELEILRIRPLKDALPNCTLIVNTNGDYLTKERVQNLSVSGLDVLMISCYDLTHKIGYEWDIQSIEQSIIAKAEKLCLPPPTFTSGNPEILITTGDYIENMNVLFIAQNFHHFAYDRGGTMSNVFNTQNSRNKLCVAPYIQAAIGYDGTYGFCSNIYSEAEMHKQYIMGNVSNDDLFTIYLSEKITSFRKKSIFNKNIEPCRTCAVDVDLSIFNAPNQKLKNRPRYRQNSKYIIQ